MATICVVPVQARASSGFWHWFAELFDLASEVKEFGEQIAEGLDLTNRVDLNNENLESTASKAEKFHAPNGQTNQMPQFGPEDLFSSDPARRQEVEDQWDAYVAAQRKSRSLLQDRRDQQAAKLENYRTALKISDVMKDFFWKVGKTPGTLPQYEYAKKAADLEGVSQNLGKVILEYERIVKEYDQNIGRLDEQIKKDVNAQDNIHDILKVMPSTQAPGPSKVVPPAVPKTQPPNTSSVIDQRISGAMSKGGSDYRYKAQQDIQTLRDKHDLVQKQNEVIGSQQSSGGTAPSTSGPSSGEGAGGTGNGGGNDANSCHAQNCLQTTVP